MQNTHLTSDETVVPTDFSARLQLHELGKIDDAPATLTFERLRSVDLPWKAMIKATGTSREQSAAHASEQIRLMVETSWAVATDRALVNAEIKEIFSAGQITGPVYEGRVVPAEGKELSDEQKQANEYLALNSFGPYYASGASSAFKEGVFARLPSGRSYRLIFSEIQDSPITVKSFQGEQDYINAWKRVIGAEVVIEGEPEKQDPTTVMERIDLRAQFIERRYEQLFSRRIIAINVNEAAIKIFEDSHTENLNSPQRLEELKINLISAAADLNEIQREFRRLVRQASELGYTLVPHPLPIDKDDKGKPVYPPAPSTGEVIWETSEDDKSKSVAVDAGKKFIYGALYYQTSETRSWTPIETVSTTSGWWFWKKNPY